MPTLVVGIFFGEDGCNSLSWVFFGEGAPDSLSIGAAKPHEAFPTRYEVPLVPAAPR